MHSSTLTEATGDEVLADTERFAVATDVFTALAEPTRLRILSALAVAPRSPGELRDQLGLTPDAVAYHLLVLRDAHLATGGPGARHRLAPEAPARVAAALTCTGMPVV
ncbi:MAG: metalloregulator ArsR/SmtB family transcription factor [Actinomycetota bacterium]|nr:metalloregulator ArsR/SmtB family transcription factor [Actinomycetota bacterium]